MNYYNKDKGRTSYEYLCKSHSARSEKVSELYRVCPSKLSKQELEDLYFALLDKNLELKKTNNDQEDQIKVLSTKVQRITAAQKNLQAKETKDCCVATKALVNEQKESINDLKKANERLSERIRGLNMKLCSAKQFLNRNPLSSTTRCLKCSGTSLSLKITASSPKRGASLKAVSCQNIANTTAMSFVQSGAQTDRDSVDMKSVQTEPRTDGASPDQRCDENKCRTTMDELKQKISNLVAELSHAHNGYSERITRLEREISDVRSENVRVRSERLASEHQLQVCSDKSDKLSDCLRQAEQRCAELETALAIEKWKVTELETQLKMTDLSVRVSKAIEEQLAAINADTNAAKEQYPMSDSNISKVVPTMSQLTESLAINTRNDKTAENKTTNDDITTKVPENKFSNGSLITKIVDGNKTIQNDFSTKMPNELNKCFDNIASEEKKRQYQQKKKEELKEKMAELQNELDTLKTAAYTTDHGIMSNDYLTLSSQMSNEDVNIAQNAIIETKETLATSSAAKNLEIYKPREPSHINFAEPSTSVYNEDNSNAEARNRRQLSDVKIDRNSILEIQPSIDTKATIERTTTDMKLDNTNGKAINFGEINAESQMRNDISTKISGRYVTDLEVSATSWHQSEVLHSQNTNTVDDGQLIDITPNNESKPLHDKKQSTETLMVKTSNGANKRDVSKDSIKQSLEISKTVSNTQDTYDHKTASIIVISPSMNKLPLADEKENDGVNIPVNVNHKTKLLIDASPIVDGVKRTKQGISWEAKVLNHFKNKRKIKPDQENRTGTVNEVQNQDRANCESIPDSNVELLDAEERKSRKVMLRKTFQRVYEKSMTTKHEVTPHTKMLEPTLPSGSVQIPASSNILPERDIDKPTKEKGPINLHWERIQNRRITRSPDQGTYTVDTSRGSTPDTEREISCMTDLPEERDATAQARRVRRCLSPGEQVIERTTSTHTDSSTSPCPGTLSEGELPGLIRPRHVLERRNIGARVSSTQQMEEALAQVSQELSRCTQLLQHSRQVTSLATVT